MHHSTMQLPIEMLTGGKEWKKYTCTQKKKFCDKTTDVKGLCFKVFIKIVIWAVS